MLAILEIALWVANCFGIRLFTPTISFEADSSCVDKHAELEPPESTL